MKFKDARSWHYQLQGTVDPEVNADIVVMDIDADPKPLLAKDRCVLAYLSIGEAEDYRAYWPMIWERKASWPLVLGENPEWPGNYAIRFWDPAWAFLMEARAREAQEKGFTGLYLDKADVYEDIEQRWPRVARTVSGDLQMILLINKIAAAVPEMEIIMQNAPELLDQIGLLRVLDGVALEDWLFKDRAELQTTATIDRLDHRVLSSGLPAVAVEYIDHDADRYYAKKYFAARNIPLFLSSEDRELAGK